jgi:hypothetical protein
MKNDNDYEGVCRLLLASCLMVLLLIVVAVTLTSRIKRIEADVDDLRMRVIYGVNP